MSPEQKDKIPYHRRLLNFSSEYANVLRGRNDDKLTVISARAAAVTGGALITALISGILNNPEVTMLSLILASGAARTGMLAAMKKDGWKP